MVKMTLNAEFVSYDYKITFILLISQLLYV
jgi:hypothetical protein